MLLPTAPSVSDSALQIPPGAFKLPEKEAGIISPVKAGGRERKLKQLVLA